MANEIQPEAPTEVPGRNKESDPHIIQWVSVPGQPKTKVYVSQRGIPLLCQSPSTFGKPIVTMENYCKWYGVQVLHPDGRVEGADHDDLSRIADRLGHCLMGDHNYHPRLLNEYAKQIGGTADWRAIEMAGGRWVSEILDGDLPGLPNFDVPGSHE
jgi:hypothetical protein